MGRTGIKSLDEALLLVELNSEHQLKDSDTAPTPTEADTQEMKTQKWSLPKLPEPLTDSLILQQKECKQPQVKLEPLENSEEAHKIQEKDHVIVKADYK